MTLEYIILYVKIDSLKSDSSVVNSRSPYIYIQEITRILDQKIWIYMAYINNQKIFLNGLIDLYKKLLVSYIRRNIPID
ncbi:unnamed protein product [Rhizophagus irregularis]|nr:unnamed protein product [Rhizophagus irregularis]CAB5379455.1 unnamed protein product [Rhizophagus irregularis]